MLQTPLWKRLLILAICAWGIVAAMPNLFYTTVEGHNDAAKAIAEAIAIAAATVPPQREDVAEVDATVSVAPSTRPLSPRRSPQQWYPPDVKT